MDARAFNNSKHHGRDVTESPARARRRCGDIRRGLSAGCDLNADWLLVGGTTLGQHLENVKSDWDQEVVGRVDHPISAMGVIVGRQCLRAREGAIVKVVGMTQLQLRGPSLDDGDRIASEAEKATPDLDVSEAGLGIGRNAGKAPANPNQSATLRQHADQVGPATGAVWHAGSRAEVVGHADI